MGYGEFLMRMLKIVSLYEIFSVYLQNILKMVKFQAFLNNSYLKTVQVFECQ